MDSSVAAERYRRPSRLPLSGRRGRVVLGVAGVAALTAVVSSFALKQANPPVDVAVLGYKVTSDHSVDVRFQVDKSPGKTAVCTLDARDSAGQEVGRRDVTVPAVPGGPRTTVLVQTLQTSGRAIVGEVRDCTLSG